MNELDGRGTNQSVRLTAIFVGEEVGFRTFIRKTGRQQVAVYFRQEQVQGEEDFKRQEQWKREGARKPSKESPKNSGA